MSISQLIPSRQGIKLDPECRTDKGCRLRRDDFPHVAPWGFGYEEFGSWHARPNRRQCLGDAAQPCHSGTRERVALDRRKLRRPHSARYPYKEGGSSSETSVVGALETYVVEEGDTLLDVGRHFDLGYNEMTSANPGVDP